MQHAADASISKADGRRNDENSERDGERERARTNERKEERNEQKSEGQTDIMRLRRNRRTIRKTWKRGTKTRQQTPTI